MFVFCFCLILIFDIYIVKNSIIYRDYIKEIRKWEEYCKEYKK